MGDITHERRVRVVRMPIRFMLNWMRIACDRLPTHVELPRLDVPDGTLVLGIHPCYGGMTIDAVLFHPSFPEVPDGEEPPRLDLSLMWYSHELKRLVQDPDVLPDDSTPTIAHGTPA